MNEHTDSGSTWRPAFAPGQAIFDDLRALFSARLDHCWPQIAHLNALLPAGVHTLSGQKVSFVLQTQKMTALEYEQQIWDSGRVPARTGAWHDLFNVLMWSLFPQSKARVNALHIGCQQTHPGGRRSRLRDALTLIDECGIVIASRDSQPRIANFEHNWQGLFVAARDQWFSQCKPLIIGHGLYQQCLKPYLGLTAKALYLQVGPEFFELPLAEQYQKADQLLQDLLQQRGLALNPGDLLAFPLLGVPGWHPDNRNREFYQDKAYFRSRKR